MGHVGWVTHEELLAAVERARARFADPAYMEGLARVDRANAEAERLRRNTKRLVCTDSRFNQTGEVRVTGQTQSIYDLLANGVNVSLTLTKYDGSTYVYELEDEP